MTDLKTRLLRASLDVLVGSRLCAALDGKTGGVGVVFMLHHVLDDWAPPDFAPNRGLEVSDGFLREVIGEVRRRGYDIVDLDEARRRLVDGDFSTRFAAFTLDDGYADNYRHAWPVFSELGVPFTIYLNSGIPDGTTLLWWRVLERVLAENDRVEIPVGARTQHFELADTPARQRAFVTVRDAWRRLEIDTLHANCRALGERHGIDPAQVCREAALSWDMLREMHGSGLCTVGSHTAGHAELSRLDDASVERELALDRARIAEELGNEPRHFAYPYGDRASAASREFALLSGQGFETAVTTRKGVLFAEHAQHLFALPRLSLNGDFQHLRYLRALMSGAPFALRRGLRRLDVA